MTQDNLVIQVRWVSDWYHGDTDWPPAPFRLHQALMDGATEGDRVPEPALTALKALEELPSPEILAPAAERLRKRRLWVPNNDRDHVKGLSAEIAKLRTAKDEAPVPLPENTSVWYRWADAKLLNRDAVQDLVQGLYRLGRGVDMAWANCSWMGDSQWQTLLTVQHRYRYMRPSDKGVGVDTLRIATEGSTASLTARHQARGTQFIGKKGVKQAPPAKFNSVNYNASTDYLHLTIHPAEDTSRTAPIDERRCVALAASIREHLVQRLKPNSDYGEELNRVVLGKDAKDADKRCRLRITPLPSTGQQHVRGIRRVLIERPDRCPVPLDDLRWAVNGLHFTYPAGTGKPPTDPGDKLVLYTASNDKVFARYGLVASQPSRHWQTITPVALPGVQLDTPLGTLQSFLEQTLRHAGVRARAKVLRLQREPFHVNETASNAFADERFEAQDLWHLQIELDRAIQGPLLLGNGRYLGLGLFRQLQRADTQVFTFEANAPLASQRVPFLNDLRRALMGRERQEFGNAGVLFSGHEPDGAVTRRGHHPHAFLCAEERDGRLSKVLVVPPWVGDQRSPDSESLSERFERCCATLQFVNAGHLGKVVLRRAPDAETETTSNCQTWHSLTPYQSTRYPKKRQCLDETIREDLILTCTRLGLPRPEVVGIEHRPGQGRPSAHLTIRFDRPVSGPLLLGGNSHRGSGHFIPLAELSS